MLSAMDDEPGWFSNLLVDYDKISVSCVVVFYNTIM